MKTKINKLDIDWINVKNKCRTTVGKSYSEVNATEDFKKKLLISQHSPMRLLKVDFTWNNIKSWCATHFSRHKWECFISTKRSDRTGVDRGFLSQDESVILDGEMNAQHLVDTSRVRLCYQASKETREFMEDLKDTLHSIPETKEIADVMVPNCIYRNGCPEGFSPCNFFDKFSEDKTKEELCNIQTRYDLYNNEFYEEEL